MKKQIISIFCILSFIFLTVMPAYAQENVSLQPTGVIWHNFSSAGLDDDQATLDEINQFVETSAAEEPIYCNLTLSASWSFGPRPYFFEAAQIKKVPMCVMSIYAGSISGIYMEVNDETELLSILKNLEQYTFPDTDSWQLNEFFIYMNKSNWDISVEIQKKLEDLFSRTNPSIAAIADAWVEKEYDDYNWNTYRILLQSNILGSARTFQASSTPIQLNVDNVSWGGYGESTWLTKGFPYEEEHIQIDIASGNIPPESGNLMINWDYPQVYKYAYKYNETADKLEMITKADYGDEIRTLDLSNYTGGTSSYVLTQNQLSEAERSPLFFNDISPSNWFYDSVRYVYRNGIMTGLDEMTFGPDVNLSRAHFATILHRLEGSPAISYTERFPDVPDGMFYTSPVLWASGAGIVGGYENGTYGVSDNITREQMAVMMYRYAEYKKYDRSSFDDLSRFPDRDHVSTFSKEAMQWAVGAGLISGDQGLINPQGYANRAQCATIIMRFMKIYS